MLMGAVLEVGHADRAQEVARQYAAAVRGALIGSGGVCNARRNRAGYIGYPCGPNARGAVAEGSQLTRDVPLNWTAAQKGDPRNFSTGQVLGFHRAVKGIAKNETVEVVRVADKGVVIRNADGEERTLTIAPRIGSSLVGAEIGLRAGAQNGNSLVAGVHRGIIAARQLAMRLSMRETESAPVEIYQHELRREQHRERDFGR